VVEEDAVAGKDVVGLAIVDDDPVGVELGHSVGRARVKGRGLVLRDRLHLAVELAGRGLVEAGGEAGLLDGVDEAQGAHGIGLGGVFGQLERDLDMALGRQIIDLVGMDLFQQPVEVARVGQIAIGKEEALVVQRLVVEEVVDAAGVEGAGAADDAVDLVAFFEQQLGEVGAILSGDAGN